MARGRLVLSRSGFRRRRRLRQDRRGVVAVVGTLLALLVFFALFGIFLTQYVPLWMEENESQLSSATQASLATLKSGVDDQYIFGTIPSYAVPFSLNSQSVPLLSQPTIATLAYLSGCPGGFFPANNTPQQVGSCDFERLSYTTGAGPVGTQNHPYTQTVSTDYLEVSLPDRYYAAVDYFFEDDGLAAAQSLVHQSMLVPPPLNVSKTGGLVSFDASLLVLLGSTASFTAQGSKDVTSSLLASGNVSSAGRFLAPGGAAKTFNVTVTVGVHAVCAWYNYLYNMSLGALGPSSGTTWTLTGTGPGGALALPPSATVCINSLYETYDLTLEAFGVTSAYTFVGQVGLSFNAGGL
jgi:hypothetical protein